MRVPNEAHLAIVSYFDTNVNMFRNVSWFGKVEAFWRVYHLFARTVLANNCFDYSTFILGRTPLRFYFWGNIQKKVLDIAFNNKYSDCV
jgi:hypothetical protein